MLTDPRKFDLTQTQNESLRLVFRSRVLRLAGSFQLDDEVLGSAVDTAALPVTYDYLINIGGHNYLVYPDDVALVSRVDQEAEHESLLIRVIAPGGEIRQIHIQGKFLSDPSLQNTRTHQILDNINDACFELDQRGTIMFVNRKGEELVMQTKESMLSRNVWEVFPELVNTRCYQAIQVLGLEKKEYTHAEYISGFFGHWISMRVTPTDDGCIILLHEIEDIMDVRRNLQEEHRRLKEAQAIGHVGSYEWNAASNKLYWSDEMFRIHRLEPQSREITIETALAFVHPEDKRWVVEKFLAAREAPVNESIVHRLLLDDGQVRIVERRFQSIANEKGKVTHITGSIQDITDAKKAEQQLQKNLQILKQTEEVADMGSWEFDIEQNQFHWSDGMYKIFGLEPGSEVRPETYLDFAAIADRPVAQRIVGGLRGHTGPFVETLHINAGGKTKTLKIKGAVLKNEVGKPVKIVGIDVDVTTKAESEQALRDQSHFISNIVKTIPDMVSVINLETRRIEYINKDPFNREDVTPEKILQMDPAAHAGMIHTDDVSAVRNYFDTFHTLGDDVVNTVEYRARAPGRHWEWFRSHGKVFKRNDRGISTHCVNVVQNVTEAKKNQDAIIRMKEALARKAQEQYDELFRSIDQGFAIIELIYDQDNNPYNLLIHQTNPALHKITGFKNIAGKTLREFLPSPAEDWFKTFGKIVDAQRPFRFTVKAQELGGAWFDIHAFPTGGPNSRRVAILFNDITETVNAEQRLRDKQLKLDIAERAGRVGIWTFDPERREGIATKEWIELTGYPGPSETWSLEKLLPLIDPNDAAKLEEAFSDRNKYPGIDVEFRIEHPERGLQWFLMRGSYITSRENMDGALMGSIIDITDRKAFEEQKDQFIGIASHELKTPVTSIKAYAEILHDFYKVKGQVPQSMMMERLVSQVDRLTKLINDLLDTTKITGGGLNLEPGSFDLNKMVIERVEEMQRTTNHTLTVRPASLPVILADKDRISQVITNLLSNAVKYSPEGSEVIITTELEEKFVVVRVRDQGIGLSEPSQQKIFDRFYRVNDERQSSVSGLGLGLFIASEIVRKHHGEMGVISKEGEGSEFYFRLPR